MPRPRVYATATERSRASRERIAARQIEREERMRQALLRIHAISTDPVARQIAAGALDRADALAARE